MKTEMELKQFGKEISQKYIVDNTPMTDSLLKVASDFSLNEQELYRVAETANVDTYLTLLEKSEDKYLNFPLADARTAYEKYASLNKVAEVSSDNEYEDINSIKDEMNTFSFIVKVANCFSDDIKPADPKTKLIKEAQRLRGTIDYIENSYYDEAGYIAKKYNKVEQMLKQAFLSGTTFNDIKNIISDAAPDLAPGIIPTLQESLKSRSLFMDFNKVAKFSNDEIDRDSDVYLMLKDINNKYLYMNKIAELFVDTVGDYNLLVKENKIAPQKSYELTVLSTPILNKELLSNDSR